MDPNEALAIIRTEISKVLDENDPNNPELLAEAMRGLDEWLSKGGYLPDEWKAMSNNGW